jgi:hypothetical protein
MKLIDILNEKLKGKKVSFDFYGQKIIGTVMIVEGFYPPETSTEDMKVFIGLDIDDVVKDQLYVSIETDFEVIE